MRFLFSLLLIFLVNSAGHDLFKKKVKRKAKTKKTNLLGNFQINRIEGECSLGWGNMWTRFHGNTNAGFTYIHTPQNFKGTKLSLTHGLYFAVAHTFYGNWSEIRYYAISINFFTGLRYFIDENLSLETNLVWNPYVKGRNECLIFDGNNNNATLLAIAGLDVNVKWKYKNNVYVGFGYSTRFNFANITFLGLKSNSKWILFNEYFHSLNRIKILIGFSYNVGENGNDIIPVENIDILRNSFEIGCNMGCGNLWKNFGGSADVGFTHIKTPNNLHIFEKCKNLRLNYGLYCSFYLKKFNRGMFEYSHAIDASLFAGIRYIANKNTYIETNFVWAPCLKRVYRPKFEYIDFTIFGFDSNIKKQIDNWYVGIGYSCRFNIMARSFTSLEAYNKTDEVLLLNTLKILFGRTISV